MNATGRQRLVTARKTTQAATETMRIAWVAPRVLKISLLQRVQAGRAVRGEPGRWYRPVAWEGSASAISAASTSEVLRGR